MRWKILGSIMIPVMILLLVLTGAISALILADNAREVDEHLAREARELSLLAERATDSRTGATITDPQQLLELYITRTIPDPNETMFVLSDDVVFARTTDTPAVRLDLDVNFLNLVMQTEVVQFGDWATEVGNARYVIVPVSSNQSTGALVAVIFSDLDAAPIRELLVRFGLIALFSLIGMVAVGYLAAGRIFKPIRTLTDFASELSEDELGKRIPVGEVRDELDVLAMEFNTMLDRIEIAFQSQREFVDIAGHELRTPLTIIRGHFDLMRANPTEAATAMPIIEDELNRMSRLVTDLQTLTKSSAPEFVNVTEVDLPEFSNDLRAKIATMTDRRVKIVGANGSWQFDPQRISQAVLQLVENATKYTPVKAKILIELSVSGSWLEISVSDSGQGVAPELRQQIWEPFVRGKDKQNVDGSGIGLSLVRAIARAHGGEAHVTESDFGGAKFSLRIPR